MKYLSSLVLVATFVTLPLCTMMHGGEQVDKGSVSASVQNTAQKLDKLIKRVNIYYRENNFQPLLPEKGWTKKSGLEKYYYQLPVDAFEVLAASGHGHDGSAEILTTSLRPIKFSNYGIPEAADRSSDGLEKREDLPEEKIKAIAKEFADIFLEDWGISDLKFERIYWNKPYIRGTNGKGSYYHSAGNWEILWRRVSPSGIVYNEDSVKVRVYAKYGPSALSIFYTTRYEEKPFTKIGEAKAMQLAKDALPKILKESRLDALLGAKPTESQPARITEFIVRAPHRTEGSNPALNDGREGRHAYVVGFYLAGKNNADPVEKKLILHIDAETGELLNAVY